MQGINYNMRLRRYLINEKIKNPPMNPPAYFKAKLRQMDKLSKLNYPIVKFTKKYENDDDMYEFFKEATYTDTGDYLDIGQASYLFKKINEFAFSGITSLADTMGDLMRYKDDSGNTFNTIFNSLVDSLRNEYGMETIRSLGKDVLEKVNNPKRLEQTLKDYMEYDPDKKYKDAYKMIKDMKTLLNGFFSFYDGFKEKIISFKDSLRHDWNPEHDDIEELYHTTMYSKEILRKGFDKKTPKDRIGLGGATKGVSMTSDLKIAQDISRFLKEVIMIFSGKLKYRTIVDWMKREGIDPEGYRTLGREPETVVELAKFYEYYLTMSKMRTNPWTMWSDKKAVKAFFRRKVSDVAILKCKVDMTNTSIEFVKGEREYRVPPESIISCRKL
jgi:hypothetical protein